MSRALAALLTLACGCAGTPKQPSAPPRAAKDEHPCPPRMRWKTDACVAIEPCPRGFQSSYGRCVSYGFEIPDGCHGNSVAACQRLCDATDVEACAELSMRYVRGIDGVVADRAKAKELARRACEGGSMRGCANVAALLTTEDSAHDPVAAKRDFEAGTRSCASGWLPACLGVAHAYRYGLGIPVDVSKAVEIVESWCAKGAITACKDLSDLLVNLEDFDIAKAIEVSVRACDAGAPLGCENAAWACAQGIDHVPNEICAVTYATRACDGGSATGCFYLGQHLEAGRGGLAKDPQRAADLFLRACNGGDGAACVAAGTYAPATAQALFKRGCDLGNEDACDRARVGAP